MLSADFDGDRAGDVLVASVPDASEGATSVWPIRAEVRTGRDFHVLFSIETASGFAGAADFDGDGDDDLITLDYIGAAPNLWLASGSAVIQRVRAFSGPSGVLLWERFYPLSILGTAGGSVPRAERFEGLIVNVVPVPADARARGSDLFVGLFDAATIERREGVASSRTALMRFRGEVLAGHEGTSLGASESPGYRSAECRTPFSCDVIGGTPWMTPVTARAPGDGVLIAATEFPQDGAGTLDVRGAAGARRWTTPIGSSEGYPLPMRIDPSADTDVMMVRYPLFALSLERFDAGGKAMWRRTGIRALARAGDVDGDGGEDLIIQNEEGELEATAGLDGRPLWTSRLRFDPATDYDGGNFGFEFQGDFTGDGVLDPLLRAHLSRYDEAGRDPEPSASRFAIRDGRTGEIVGLSPLYPPRAVARGLAGDADGDGRPDLTVGVRTGAGEGHRWTQSIVSAATMTELWSHSEALAADEFESYSVSATPIAADLAGVGAHDVVLGISESGWDAVSQETYAAAWVTVLSGGIPIWRSR